MLEFIKHKKDHDAPALIIMALLSLLTFLLFGYIFFKMSTAPEQSARDNASVAKEIKPNAPLDASKINIESDGQARDFVVWNGQTRVGEIMEATTSAVKFFRRQGDDVILGVEKGSVVEDDVFSGPQELYKLNLRDNRFNKLFDGDAFVTDISADGSRLASSERFFLDGVFHNYINVIYIASMKTQSFEASSDCQRAGNAYFSKSGQKLAYETVSGEGTDVKYRMYVVDLETGAQEQLGGDDALGKAKQWAESN
jgi:hypothetical protein